MPNHVLRDGIWRSKRLGKLPWKLASMYPWIFLVCDDWGRFEYRPHWIWNNVFAPRRDFSDDLPSFENVTLALSEYARVGLLVRYHIDGDLAAWRKFRGKPISKRNDTQYPDPVDFVGDILDDDNAWSAWTQTGGYLGPSPEGTPEGTPGLPSNLPLIDRSREEKIRLDRSGTSPRRKTGADTPDTPEARATIAVFNEILGRRIQPSAGNLAAAQRAIDHGHTVEQARTAFEVVRDKRTDTGKWCAENCHSFEFLTRPAYKHRKTGALTLGPIEKIHNELGQKPIAATAAGSGVAAEMSRLLAEKAARKANGN